VWRWSTIPDLKAAAEGRSIRDIAAKRKMTEREVLAILDKAAEAWGQGDRLRRELLYEVERLDALEAHYYAKALSGDEGANAAGALYVKLAERKSTLLGLNAPVASAAVIIHQTTPAGKVTSTERIRAAIDRIRGEHRSLVEDSNGTASE
jgi:hypothetical protein